MSGDGANRQPISVILPPEPPRLTPGAARALLKILVKAYEKQVASDAATADNVEESP